MNKRNLIGILIMFVVLLGTTTFFGIRAGNQLDRLTRIEINKSILNKANKETPRLAIVPKGDNPVIGADSAKVEMIVFVDYQCGFCKAFIKEQLPVLREEYVSNGSLQVIFRDYPLAFHANAKLLARVGHAMYLDNRFEAFLNDVWDLDKNADSASIFNSFNIENISPRATEAIQNNIEESRFLAGVAGITSTPTIIVNNRMLVGLRTIEELRSIIEYSMNNTITSARIDGACGE